MESRRVQDAVAGQTIQIKGKQIMHQKTKKKGKIKKNKGFTFPTMESELSERT